MKHITLSLFLLILLSITSYAANVVGTAKFGQDFRSIRYIITIDSTNAVGAECVDMEGWVQKTVMFNLTAGTIVYDIEWSNNGTFYDDLNNASAQTADESFEFITSVQEVCIHITTCTGCAATVYVMGQELSRDWINP